MSKKPPDQSKASRALTGQKTATPSESNTYEFRYSEPETASLDLVELKLWPPRQGERTSEFPLWTDLRFAEQVITTPHWRIVIQLARAELRANLEGCTVAPGTILGDSQLPLTEIVTENRTGETNTSDLSEVSGRLGLSLTSGLVGGVQTALGSKSRTQTKIVTQERTEKNRPRVAALPNNRWEISDSGGLLKYTYLRAPAADEHEAAPLCKIHAVTDKFQISLDLEARPQQIHYEVTPLAKSGDSSHEFLKLFWRTNPKAKPNKEAVVKMLVEKARAERFGRSGDERVTLARTRLEGERSKNNSESESDAIKS